MSIYDLPVAKDRVPNWDEIPTELTWQEKVAYLAYQFLKLVQLECPVAHIFGNGIYIREMHIPKGILFLGRAHLVGHQCHLISGSLIWITPKGKAIVDRPMSLLTDPGWHMVFYTMTDIVCKTYHPNYDNSRDIDKLESQIFEAIDVVKERGRLVAERLRLAREQETLCQV